MCSSPFSLGQSVRFVRCAANETNIKKKEQRKQKLLISRAREEKKMLVDQAYFLRMQLIFVCFGVVVVVVGVARSWDRTHNVNTKMFCVMFHIGNRIILKILFFFFHFYRAICATRHPNGTKGKFISIAFGGRRCK